MVTKCLAALTALSVHTTDTKLSQWGIYFKWGSFLSVADATYGPCPFPVLADRGCNVT